MASLSCDSLELFLSNHEEGITAFKITVLEAKQGPCLPFPVPMVERVPGLPLSG